MADHFVPVQHYGDWNLEKQLGYGACGTVCLWRNVKSTQEIAIKKCNFDKSDERARDRWKTEVGMLSKMHHPNIVSYLAIPRIMEKQYPEYCSLGMEYCSAGDLRKIPSTVGRGLTQEGMHRTGPLLVRLIMEYIWCKDFYSWMPTPFSRFLRHAGDTFIWSQPEHNCGLAEHHVRDVMGDIGSAIYYLHQKNNMHRDLKPENIVLKPRPDCPERYLYKITDLGYAKDLDNTHGRTLVGTLQYLAPELVSGPPGELRYNTEVDCWSFGLVVFECATGFRPFFHLSNSEPALPVNLVTDKPDDAICAWHDRRTKEAIFCDTIPQPHSLNPHFSNDVGLWLRLMLRVDKEKRGGNNGEEWYHMLKNSILPKKYVHVLNTTNMQLITSPLGEDALPHTVQIKVQQEASVDKAEQLLLFEDGNVPHMTENIFNQLTKIKPKAPDQPIIYFFDKRAIEWPVYKSETPDRIRQYFANENTAIDQGNRDGMRLMQIILHDILSKLKTTLHFYDSLFALAERRIKVAKNLRDELQEYRRTNFRTAGMVELFRISLEKDVAEDNSQDNSSGICASDEYIKECEAVRMDLEGWNREIDEGQSLIVAAEEVAAEEVAAEEIVSKTKSSLQLSKSRHDLSALRLASLKFYSEFRNKFKKIEKSSTEYSSKALKTLCKEHLVTFVNNYWRKTKRMLEEALSPQSNLRKTMRFDLIQLTELERILFAMKDRSHKCECVSCELQDKQERRQHSLWNMLQCMKDIYNAAHSYKEDANAAEDMTTSHNKIRGVMDDMMMNGDVLAFTNFAASKKQNGTSTRSSYGATDVEISKSDTQSTSAPQSNPKVLHNPAGNPNYI